MNNPNNDEVLNIAFHCLHLSLIFFNLFGWVWSKTRFLNLVSLSITGFFWLIAGLWFGFGYCPLTDWHWEVKARLGHLDLPDSYIKFILDFVTKQSWDPALVDKITVTAFSVALICSFIAFFKTYKIELHKN